MRKALVLSIAVLALVLAAGCSSCDRPPAALADAAPSDASIVDAAAPVHDKDDAVRPVYPLDAGPPAALAVRLCDALQELPARRKAECCKQPLGTVVTSECVRMLTAALGARAVSLADADVDRCAAAVAKTYEGCDWPGPSTPDVPDACLGILKGTLAAGAKCRSSLECAKDLRCHGVGPTQAGTCGPAREDGLACGLAVDPLAGYTLQNGVLDPSHPECAGYCNRNKCAHEVAPGGDCSVLARCAKGATCQAGKCVAAAAAKIGEKCPAGTCEGDARCYFGRCVVRKPAGAPCTDHVDCVGGCIKSAGAKSGVCGPMCAVR
jgi:hypothetical protein